MKQLAILLSLAFVFTSCDSVLSPESGTTETQQHSFLSPPNQILQAPGRPEQGRWQKQKNGTTAPLFDVHFVDEQTGWAVGGVGTILYTTNGGQSWQTQDIGTSVSDGVIDVHFVDAQTGWVVMQTSGEFSGAPGWNDRLYHTNDGGTTWQYQEIQFRLTSVYFDDLNNGWVTGGAFHGPGCINATRNGGQDWPPQHCSEGRNETMWNLHFFDSQTGWAFGPDGLVGTTDGSTWKSLAKNIWGSIYFTDAQTGWIVGSSGILHSTDGGHTWQLQDSGTTAGLSDVHFINAQSGWAVGEQGTILHTTDGGQTWQRQESGSEEWLQSVHFVDTPEGPQGWAVGNNGTILHYSAGQEEPPPPAEPSVQTIYEEQLNDPWINASWSASVDFASTEQARSGSRSIRVDQQTWGALSLRSGRWGDPQHIQPGRHERIEFAIYAPEQPVRLDLRLENEQGNKFPRVRYGTVEPGAWTVVSVPLAKLNPEGRSWNRVDILESGGQPVTYFVDDLRLAGGAAPPPKREPEALTVYQDALSEPWFNASWSTSVDYKNSTPTHSGSYSIRVDQRAWGALSVRSGQWGNPQNIEPGRYEQVTFAVYAQQPLTLDLLLENEEGTEFPRVRHGTIEAGSWQMVSVPLAELNPDGQPFNRIDITESSGQAKTYFVDELKLEGSSGGGPMAANN